MNQRIHRQSSSRRTFEESECIYDEALKNSGFQGRLEYVNPMNSSSNGRSNSSGTCTLVKVGDTNNNHSNRRGKSRNRKVIWFNSPFHKLINISKYFLNLLDKHFNPLKKNFDRNTVKICYSCTKRAFPPLNIIIVGRRSISVSLLGIGNTNCIIIILSPIHGLETKLLYQNIFGALRIRG